MLVVSFRMRSKNPVLILTWRRPEYLAAQLAAVKQYKPDRVYVFSDGWREGFDQEKRDVQRCRRDIGSLIDWECDVFSNFSEKNLGCRNGVISGIDWFFKNEAQGIVLEDDIIPSEYFWPYMDEYLERYRDNPKIGAVAGSSFVSDSDYQACDSYLSSVCQVWGWGTWARAWRVNTAIDADYAATTKRVLTTEGYTDEFIDYWTKRFREVTMGEIDTWDYGWIYACIKNGMQTCTPVVSLVHNIGFGEKATHTKDKTHQDLVRGVLICTDYRVAGKKESVDIDCRVFNERFKLSACSRLRRRLNRNAGSAMTKRLWISLDVNESTYLGYFLYGDISYQELCCELDRVWKQLGCNNNTECQAQKELLGLYYRHPVWRLNGLYSEKDSASIRIRKAISHSIKALEPDSVIDFGGGSGVLARMIRKDCGIDARVYDPYNDSAAENVASQADIVIALDVLEHSDKPLELLEEAKKMTRDGGYMYIGNCFYPVIQCHMRNSFYLRYLFRIACGLSGLEYIHNVCGAGYVGVYRLKDREKRVGRELEYTLQLVGERLNYIGDIAKVVRRVVRASRPR